MRPITVTIQGQRCSPDLSFIERLLAEHPDWGRSRLSVALCEQWNWRGANGQLKDMACRSLLCCAWSARARSGYHRGNASPPTATATAPRRGFPMAASLSSLR